MICTHTHLCQVCGLPAEYCEFGPDFNRCKPWLIEHCPELYPELVKKEEGGEAAGAEGTLSSVRHFSNLIKTLAFQKRARRRNRSAEARECPKLKERDLRRCGKLCLIR